METPLRTQVTDKVVDERTELPLGRFQVLLEFLGKNRPEESKSRVDGAFTFSLTTSVSSLGIQALGYETAYQKLVLNGQSDLALALTSDPWADDSSRSGGRRRRSQWPLGGSGSCAWI